MTETPIVVYRLVESSGAADPLTTTGTGRHTFLPAVDPSPIGDGHRGVEYSAIESWAVDSVATALRLRSAHATAGEDWIITRRHTVVNGAPFTETDAGFGIVMVVAMCCLEGLPLDSFQQHWLNEHARLTVEAPGTSRYEIALPVVDEYLNARPTFDGLAVLWWRSQADIDAYMASPVMNKIGPDMELFVSGDRPFYSLYSTRGERWS